MHDRIQTSNDNLFIVDKNSLKSDFYTKTVAGQKYYIEKDICVDVVKINKEINKTRSYAIIFPYSDTNSIIHEDDLTRRYPEAYEYLKAIKHELVKRNKGRIDKFDSWYAYGKKQGFNIDFTNKTCILLPTVQKENDVEFEVLSSKERFVHQSGLVIIPKDGEIDRVETIMRDPDFLEYLNANAGKLSGSEHGVDFNNITKKMINNYPYIDRHIDAVAVNSELVIEKVS